MLFGDVLVPEDAVVVVFAVGGGVVAVPAAGLISGSHGIAPFGVGGFTVCGTGVIVCAGGVAVCGVGEAVCAGGVAVCGVGEAVCAGGVAVCGTGDAVCAGGVAVCGLGEAVCAGGVAVCMPEVILRAPADNTAKQSNSIEQKDRPIFFIKSLRNLFLRASVGSSGVDWYPVDLLDHVSAIP